MSPSDITHSWFHSGGQRFPPTSWSLVLAAGRLSSSNSREALAALCSIYWYALYAYVRQAGHSVDTAQDLTQGFFARLLDENYLGYVRPERGRFRSFEGAFPAFLKFLRTDLRSYFSRSEEILPAYRDIAERADAELPKLFAELPRTPYGIREIPAYQGESAAYYSPGSPDGSRTGFFNAPCH